MLRMFVMLTVLLVQLFAIGQPAFAARLALVIGNDNYAEVTKLEKAQNDASAMADTLMQLNFTVSLVLDANRREMNSAIQEFVAAVNPGDTALVFYAGHGVEIDGDNYLLPIDTPDASGGQDDFIAAEAIALDDLLDRLRDRKAQLNIVVLDACRNNPFSGKGTRSLGGSQGLARISAPQGTFVMYSADVGEAALDRLGNDDANPNSVFTRTLIPLLKKPGIDLVDTAREVRRKVRDLASTIRHDQTPAYYDAVLGDFFFSSAKEPPPPQPGQTDQPKPEESSKSAGKTERSTPQARTLIVTGGEKDTIRLWDAENASMLGELEGEKISLASIAFIDGGRSLAVAGDDGALFAYSIPQFKKTAAVYPGFRVTSVAQLPDGTLLIGGENGSLAALRAGDWQSLWMIRPHAGIVSPIIIREDGRKIVTASADGTVLELDVGNGEILRRATTIDAKEITDIEIVSQNIVVAVHEDGDLAYLNLATGETVSSFKANKGWISSVDASLDGASFVTAGVDGELAFWALGTDGALARIKGHTDLASAAKFLKLKDGEHLVSSGFDGAVRIWNTEASKPLAILDHGSAILHFDIHQGS